jgi:hypothetical protein
MTGLTVDAHRAARATRALSHPLFIACLVAVVYVGQARYASHHAGRLDYVKMDVTDTRRGYGHSPTIDRAIREGPVHRNGYDGQYFYFMALDPMRAAPYLADPGYRYSRIGYPLVARAVALGHANRVRGALVLVNGIAIALATLFLGLILVRFGASAWWSLLLATYPGLMAVAFTRDTCEPLAYALALAGLWVVVSAAVVTDAVAVGAGLLFGAAALTRETTLLLALPAAAALARRHRRPALILASISLLPYLAWRAFLLAHYHQLGGYRLLTPFPFGGIVSRWPWGANEWVAVLSVVVPVLVTLALTARRRFARRSPLLASLVVANCLLLVFSGWSVYDGYGSIGRVAVGAAAATFISFPVLRETWGHRVALTAILVWSFPLWLLASVPRLL